MFAKLSKTELLLFQDVEKSVALIGFDEYKELSNHSIFGLAGLVGTIEDGDELAQII